MEVRSDHALHIKIIYLLISVNTFLTGVLYLTTRNNCAPSALSDQTINIYKSYVNKLRGKTNRLRRSFIPHKNSSIEQFCTRVVSDCDLQFLQGEPGIDGKGIKGCKGEKGDEGEDGKPGPKGDRGEKGTQGVAWSPSSNETNATNNQPRHDDTGRGHDDRYRSLHANVHHNEHFNNDDDDDDNNNNNSHSNNAQAKEKLSVYLNPRLSRILGWDDGRQIDYQILFE
uniref:Collagen alpha-1(VII) chain n=1 Tax=Magallana gigas TaxID=29159 RepID=K1QTB4_MAGGI